MAEDIQSAYQEELERLHEANAAIDTQLERLKAIPRYYGTDFTEQVLDSMREETRVKLGIAQGEAYFGRLDFHEAGKAEPQPLYIGKAGVEDEATGKPLIIDWRAPVASLFYSFTGGEDAVTYESPDGIIEGLVYLKRNLAIRRRILERVVDTFVKGGDALGVSDEFLLFRLGEHKDNRLRDIVSTIQAEQDKIIRAARNKALVIQGVAGSGKTTVALHRLAFLLYQYRENIKAERMIILAPNRMFLDYISGVLPELGVGDIQQTTFADWALDRLPDDIRMAEEGPMLEQWFAVKKKGAKAAEVDGALPSGRLKGSIAFAEQLAAALDRFEAGYVGSRDFQPWEGAKLLSGKVLQEWFYVENKHEPLAKRRERIVARMKRWMEIELEKTWEVHLKKERKKTSGQRLRTFLRDWQEPSPLALYKSMMESAENREWIPEELAAETLKRLKKKEASPEDLPPLLFIYNRLYGVTSEDRFDHIVIDEAQDFSPFQVEVLKQHSRGRSFTILGDLAQGIHDYRGVHRWEEMTSLFSPDETEYFQLNRSYRSTVEIIAFANGVIAKSGVEVAPAVPVFRSGEPAAIHKVDASQRPAYWAEQVRDLLQGEIRTLAVIGRTEKDCRSIHAALTEAGLDAALITASQREYGGGLSVLPVYLSKGLEFDAVLLADVDAARYTASSRDAKLLYVACTRALHKLRVQYSGEPSPLIADLNTDE